MSNSPKMGHLPIPVTMKPKPCGMYQKMGNVDPSKESKVTKCRFCLFSAIPVHTHL